MFKCNQFELSMVGADLVMEVVEQKAMSTFHSPPKIWKCFMDDTFVVIKKNAIDGFYSS